MILKKKSQYPFLMLLGLFTLCTNTISWAVEYEIITQSNTTEERLDEILKSSAKLFSNHYGVWGQHGFKPGNHVSMPSKKLRDGFFFDEQCGLVRALISTDHGKEQIGHAFFRKFTSEGIGEVYWVTQLVVHSEHRHQKIAQNLIRRILGNKYGACGLVSSHPYAIRSIESATGLQCNPDNIAKFAPNLIKTCGIPYIVDKQFENKSDSCIINTEFFVDHSGVLKVLEEEKTNITKPWQLGDLPEGYEFFAFVFPDL
jgi:hypothetical protein